ncbi:hypothetical protein I4U23_022708 [Adineta vaga]|nr:hypothetical protein I4U23_022708 [Adineta vaga]
MNTTPSSNSSLDNNIEDYRLVALISLIFVLIAVAISTFILILDTSDISCRFRAYFAYSGVAGVIYPYLIQAILRFFFSVLPTKYRQLTSFKTHYILIVCQWIVVFSVTSPSILTNDINFVPHAFCWVPEYRTIHLAYTAFAYYILPVTLIVVIYIYIYVQIRKARVNATVATQNSQKRDLELLCRILILLSIYLTGGVLAILFMLTSIQLIYMINLVSPSVTVSIEKLCTVLLDREICQVIKAKIGPVTRVTLLRTVMVLISNGQRQTNRDARQRNI